MAAAKTHVQPVFLVNINLPAEQEKTYTVSELCAAAEKISGYGTMDGAQRIRGLWRLYPNTTDARIELLSRGITLRGVNVSPRDVNPFIVSGSAEEGENPTTKLIIGDIPLSYATEEIKRTLENTSGITIRSNIMEERDRDERGKLTRWKTGRRFVYIDIPKEPLPKALNIGIFRASLYHKEQKVPICNNCLQPGHHSSTCEKPVKCKQCYLDGHRKGDAECQLAPPLPPPRPTQTNTDDREAPKGMEKRQSKLPFTASPNGGGRRSRSCTSKRRRPSHSSGSSPSPPAPAQRLTTKTPRVTSSREASATRERTAADPDRNKDVENITRESRESGDAT